MFWLIDPEEVKKRKESMNFLNLGFTKFVKLNNNGLFSMGDVTILLQ